jgi:hypothetical protein
MGWEVLRERSEWGLEGFGGRRPPKLTMGANTLDAIVRGAQRRPAVDSCTSCIGICHIYRNALSIICNGGSLQLICACTIALGVLHSQTRPHRENQICMHNFHSHRCVSVHFAIAV